MKNIIQNSRWYTDQHGNTNFFLNNGPPVDLFSIQGFRTRSLTLRSDDSCVITDIYQPEIIIQNQKALRWGYQIRAIEAQSVELIARFYTPSGDLIHTLKHPIGNYISSNFQWMMIRFPIPPHAKTVRLSMELSGKITACTYFAPTAYFCR